MTKTPTPWSDTRRVADLPPRKPTRFRLEPDSETSAAIAQSLGILGVDKLRFEGELRPIGRGDWELTAQLGATVRQACVVTLDPVSTRIDEQVIRRYLADYQEPEGEEVEMPEDDTAERLTEVIDLGTVMVEALALALPDYPRRPGAELGQAQFAAPGVTPLTDEDLRPFAGLADLLKKDEKDADSSD
ncbi:uncharacterized metal-binding protein YceD (DUF177 family) [Albidovulum inexpectatum]|uniref:Uncharacterized metal-binding protein YceD (DUF177 family) n=1 Tax=Albidovulum inexpectatum TaxID=196587 RepID=A0A2S5JF75_9RHOB|nr:DUF177 domain-containing protein [Albidovulum inexpectatum]PPB80018.1 uncharacterized metal-binding protein YceD (DUF177 family) [Albidovulum inexpectatum]